MNNGNRTVRLPHGFCGSLLVFQSGLRFIHFVYNLDDHVYFFIITGKGMG